MSPILAREYSRKVLVCMGKLLCLFIHLFIHLVILKGVCHMRYICGLRNNVEMTPADHMHDENGHFPGTDKFDSWRGISCKIGFEQK